MLWQRQTRSQLRGSKTQVGTTSPTAPCSRRSPGATREHAGTCSSQPAGCRAPRAVNTSGIKQTRGPQLVARRQRRLLAGRRSARSHAMHEPLSAGSRAPAPRKPLADGAMGAPGGASPSAPAPRASFRPWRGAVPPALAGSAVSAGIITSRHGRASWRGGRGRGAWGKGRRHLQLPSRRWARPLLLSSPLRSGRKHPISSPASPSRDGARTPRRMHGKKKKKGAGVYLNSLLQINQFHLLHLWLWLPLAVGRCPAPAPTGMAPTPAPENRRNRAPRLPIACPRVATRLWYRLTDKNR